VNCTPSTSPQDRPETCFGQDVFRHLSQSQRSERTLCVVIQSVHELGIVQRSPNVLARAGGLSLVKHRILQYSHRAITSEVIEGSSESST